MQLILIDQIDFQNIFIPRAVSTDGVDEQLLANERLMGVTDSMPEYPFENLVLSGGGIRGYAYIGAIQVHTWTFNNDVITYTDVHIDPKTISYSSFNYKCILFLV